MSPEQHPDSDPIDIQPGLIYATPPGEVHWISYADAQEVWSSGSLGSLEVGKWNWSPIDPVALRFDYQLPDAVDSLLIRQTGDVDLGGNSPEAAARLYWRAALRDPRECYQPDADGALVVLIAGKRSLVIFPDGSFDGLDDVRPEGSSREFWSHVARLYSTLPPWLFERAP